MIDRLKTLLESASEPSREIDCLMHECLTGRLNLCVDKEMREYNLKHGRMLLESGAEVLWMDIPRYTDRPDACDPLVPKEFAWSTSRLPPLLPVGKYGAAIFRDTGKDCVAYAHHEHLASLALCLAIVEYMCSR